MQISRPNWARKSWLRSVSAIAASERNVVPSHTAQRRIGQIAVAARKRTRGVAAWEFFAGSQPAGHYEFARPDVFFCKFNAAFGLRFGAQNIKRGRAREFGDYFGFCGLRMSGQRERGITWEDPTLNGDHDRYTRQRTYQCHARNYGGWRSDFASDACEGSQNFGSRAISL